ncbi:MAG: ABC transporter substrate-binding protein [Spirochaetaceae bacterium]
MKFLKIIIPSAVLLIIGMLFLFTYEAPPIKVGFITDLSGKNSNLGQSVRNGLLLAINEINESGGIKGHKIELLVQDHAGSKDNCLTGTKFLVDSGVNVIIGPILSGMASTVIAGVEGSDVLIIAPTVSSNEVSGIDDNFLRIFATSSQQGQYLAEISMARNEKNVVIVLDEKNSSYGLSVAKGYNDTTEGSDTKVSKVISFNGKSEYLDIIATLKEIEPDSIVFIANGLDSANIIQLYAKEHTIPNLYGAAWVRVSGVERFGGSRVEGMIISDSFVNPEPTESELIYMENYRKMFNQVGTTIGIYSYESMYLYKTGVDESNSFKTKNIKDTIINLDVIPGVIENYSVDKFGDGVRSLSLYIIKNNEYELYEK